jgi:hypothetical protein
MALPNKLKAKANQATLPQRREESQAFQIPVSK